MRFDDDNSYSFHCRVLQIVLQAVGLGHSAEISSLVHGCSSYKLPDCRLHPAQRELTRYIYLLVTDRCMLPGLTDLTARWREDVMIGHDRLHALAFNPPKGGMCSSMERERWNTILPSPPSRWVVERGHREKFAQSMASND